MKLSFILLFLCLSSAAQAVEICHFNESQDLKEKIILELGDHAGRSSENFNKLEESLIVRTLKLDPKLNHLSQKQAIEYFMGENQKFINNGVIDYFIINQKLYAIVSYWPANQEHGAIYHINKHDQVSLKARIVNGYIICR